jgi:hypothetical protein
MKMTLNVSEQVPGRWGSIFRILGSKIVLLFILGFLSMNTTEAQSTNDWVGNRVLVNGNAAVTKLKQAARTIVHQANQQPPSPVSTKVAEGHGVDYHFILEVVNEIAINNRNSKDAINIVALSMSTAGASGSDINRIVADLIAILS